MLEPSFAPTRRNEVRVSRNSTLGLVVFLERLDRHLFEDGWVGLPVTGVYKVHYGKTTSWRDHFDAATIAGQPPA